jgi:chemotaxis protein MotB
MARRHQHEEHQNHEAWAIPYGDLITLLLAFFVVMYAVSSVNEGKYRVLSDSLVAAFRGQPTTTSPIQVGDKLAKVKRDDSVAALSPKQALKLPTSGAEAQTSLVEQFGRMGEEMAEQTAAQAAQSGAPLHRLADEVEQAMAPLIERDLITVTRKSLWVEVEIKTDILFPSGSADMQADAIPILERIAGILQPLPSPIRVEGHTDNRPISTPQFPSNWELSGARAARIVRLFESRDIAPARMTVAGQGEHQPVADNATPEGRNHNRRVTLIILDAARDSAMASDAAPGPMATAAAPAPEVAP